MRLKVLTLIVSVIVIFSLNCCKNFFQPEEYYLSDITSNEELTTAVNGLEDYFLYYTTQSVSQSSEILGDDQLAILSGYPLKTKIPDSYASYYSKSKPQKGNESFQVGLDNWSTYYRMIASINNVLVQFDLNDLTADDTRIMLGEMIFYRAYLHYRLSLIYGRIPIVTDNEVEYGIPKSSFQDIYAFIERELSLAIKMLPENKSLTRIPYETPDQGCAKALLSEVYLSWAGYPVEDTSKYSIAAETAGEIIDNAEFYGYELLDDFEDLWNNKNKYTNEIVFCRTISDRSLLKRYTSTWMSTEEYYSGGFGVDGKIRLAISNVLVPEIQFFNSYPDNYRKDITFFTRIYVDSMCINSYTGLPNEGVEFGSFTIQQTNATLRAAYHKFFIDTIQTSHMLIGCPRIYLIRYAQTLLTYAEASARSGNLNAKAYECVNMVRRRANKLPLYEPSPYDLIPGLSSEAFADSVVQERAWELAGEIGHRWFDMVRTQTVEKVFDTKDPNDGGTFEYSENDKYFFPIPEGDINLNPNLSE